MAITADLVKDRYIEQYDYEISDAEAKFWYQAKPYCFRVTDREGNLLYFYLPINPSNLTISTHFATNVITTMYGTVEEHSEQRYFDIVIAGTTGLAPKNFELTTTVKGKSIKPEDKGFLDRLKDQAAAEFNAVASGFGANTPSDPVAGRASYPITKGDITGGFFNRTKALLQNAVNNAADFFGSSDYESGIDSTKSGYLAFHNFYRFLLAHKKDIVLNGQNERRRGDTHPIQFLNYKDNNQYDVAVQNFQMTRSSDDPMLYKYNIVLRGYNLSEIGQQVPEEDILADLGLDGIETSLKASLSNKVRSAKNAYASVVAAARGFGS